MTRLLRDAIAATVIVSTLALLAGLRHLAELAECARADADLVAVDDEMVEALAVLGAAGLRPTRPPVERELHDRLVLLREVGPAAVDPDLRARLRLS